MPSLLFVPRVRDIHSKSRFFQGQYASGTRTSWELGLLVASAMLEDEVNRLCGTRYQRQPGRSHTRYGHQRGVATPAGQKVAIERPRVRHTDGRGEVPLE